MHAGRSLDVITSATIVDSQWERLVEPSTFAAASVVAELVDAFSEPDLAQPEVYALLAAVVPALAGADDARALLPRFELRLLDALGIAPALDACVRCGHAIGAEGWLDPDAGGLLCSQCHLRGDAGRLDAGDIENLRALAAPRGGPVPAAVSANPAVARAVDATVTYHLGKRARSSAFLDELAHTP